ncbi:Hybrid signal transduction histidine kinase K [Sphaceloma murrayae]|uniref:Hybrid signal transduction histidine kinase K n=1 Tax=Sphaceloma murrayae TaxID=2082308 RepID=A0A2K1QSB0_9PEZI|nr:Hybrid signal transduction histidine kinase K [Sphaceloma murrayae]
MSVGLPYAGNLTPYVGDFTGNLTQLYTETKKSALSNASKEAADDTTPALNSLHRKFRIQKDRLITWGLEWSDEGKGPDGNIDENVARAGLTETVTSVLENIKEVLEQAERIRSASTPIRSPGWPPVSVPEKAPLLAVDIPRYRDLVTDLTTSIDILYDLSRTRRALAAGSHPFSLDNARPFGDEKTGVRDSFASEETLVAQQSGTSGSLKVTGMPPVIDLAALILPEEGPPPYANAGVPMTTRMVGRLLRAHCPDQIRFALQESFDDPLVLIEYANFDPLYRENQVPPPMTRLEALSNYLQQAKIRPQLNLLGYFDDPKESRIGLVFDLTECNLNHVFGIHGDTGPVETYSLLHILQSSSKTAKSHDTLSATPALEDRFKLALRVAERVQDVHANDNVHGNLHSGSILFVKSGDQEKAQGSQLRSPVLSSFDLFSKYQIGNQASQTALNIYQHPADHDRGFNHISAMKFDAYGLGLILLEIGLWSPLSELHKAKYNLSDFKMRLERIWIPRLTSKCGSLYMAAVQACFNFSDNQQITPPQALRLYEGTLSRLRRCCLLCDETASVGSPRNSVMSPIAESAGGDTVPNSPYDPTLPPRPSTPYRSSFTRRQVPVAPERSSTYPRSQNSVPRLQSTIPSSSDTFGIVNIKEGISAAASNLQNAWTGNRGNIQQVWTDNRGALTYPFKEYRRKVVLLQNRWREVRQRRASATDVETPQEGELHRAATAPATVAVHNQSQAITRRPVGAPPRQKAFPVNLPPPQLAEWHSNLGLRLSRIVERALKNSLESSTIDLVGFGTDEASAKPTILVTCTSTAQVKAAIKKRFKCDTTIFDVKAQSGYDSDEEIPEAQNPYYHPRPSCGASIGAYNADEGHLLPVTLGGIILVDDQPLGMSVHHMLEPPSDDEDDESGMDSEEDDGSDAASGAASSEFDSEADDVPDLAKRSRAARLSRSKAPHRSSAQDVARASKQSSNITAATNRKTHRSPSPTSTSSDIDFSAADSSPYSSDFDSDPEDSLDQAPGPIASEGDTRGFLPSAPSTSEWRITQPGLLDAQQTGWHLLDQDQIDTDEDHLASFELGRLHSSSGLRRYRDSSGYLHEIDWSLFTIKRDRRQSANLILGGKRHLPPTFTSTYHPKVSSPILRNPGDDILGTSFGPSSSGSAASPTEETRPSLPTSDSRASQREILKQAAQFPPDQDLFPHALVDAPFFAGKKVLCSGRTSGLAIGTVGAGMSFVKIYGRRTFSSSWTVVGDFGVGGDSGAWVVDCEHGRVCGAVVAEKGGVAYFAPLGVILDDIRRTLGAGRVVLPGCEEVEAGLWKDGEEVPPGVAAGNRVSEEVMRSLAVRDKTASPTKDAQERPLRGQQCLVRQGQAVVS